MWTFCLGFDVHSTYKFYLENPGQFQNNERNKLFVWFTKKFGFKKATLIFPITIELPLLLLFATIPLQILHAHIFTNNTNFIACLATSFSTAAIGHLQAAIKNTHIQTNKTTKHHGNS
jgi:hypothetical protein